MANFISGKAQTAPNNSPTPPAKGELLQVLSARLTRPMIR